MVLRDGMLRSGMVRGMVISATLALAAGCAVAQTAAAKPREIYLPVPGFDATAMDTSVSPCDDFYKFACGKFAANHPIPADQPGVDQFYMLYNVNTQELSGILEKAAAGSAGRSADERKIGDYYQACMDTAAIDAKGLAPLQPVLAEIDGLKSRAQLPALLGKLQRMGVDVFFGYGEQQDFKDATKQIATIGQGGLGLPERDYYLRTGEKDMTLRNQYVAHIAKMLVLAGSTPAQADKDAQAIMAMETALAKASLDVTTMRDPEKVYHLQPIATFAATMPGVNFTAFEDAINSPHVTEINNSTPEYFPTLMKQLHDNDLETLKAYLRYHLLTTMASRLPAAFDDENFDFYGRKLEGQPEKTARWKRCSNAVNGALGEALGKVYVEKYFAGDSEAKMLEMGARHRGRHGTRHRRLHLDVGRHQGEGQGETAPGRQQDRLPVKVARLHQARSRAGRSAGQHAASQCVRERPPVEQDRQAGEPRRVGHDAADGECLLRPQHERHQLPGGDSAAGVLRPQTG